MHFRTVSCFPIWDLLCTPVWALYGKEILGGHSFGVPLSALTAVTPPGAVPCGEQCQRRQIWTSSDQTPTGPSQAGGPGAGLWWLLHRAEAGAVPVEQGASLLSSGEGQGINSTIHFSLSG